MIILVPRVCCDVRLTCKGVLVIVHKHWRCLVVFRLFFPMRLQSIGLMCNRRYHSLFPEFSDSTFCLYDSALSQEVREARLWCLLVASPAAKCLFHIQARLFVFVLLQMPGKQFRACILKNLSMGRLKCFTFIRVSPLSLVLLICASSGITLQIGRHLCVSL